MNPVEPVTRLARPSMWLIKETVADEFAITILDLESDRRARKIARPRQVAMWLARELTTLSLPAIGLHFGNRDHTTVMHAIGRIAGLMAADEEFAAKVRLLWRALACPEPRGMAA